MEVTAEMMAAADEFWSKARTRVLEIAAREGLNITIADYLTTFRDEDWEEQAGAGWSEGCWTQKKDWRYITVIATRWEDEA